MTQHTTRGPDNDQPSRLTPQFMAGVLSGYLMGAESGYQQAEADMARLHAIAYRITQASARTLPDAEHWAAVKARQIASCEAQKAASVPWPDEATQ